MFDIDLDELDADDAAKAGAGLESGEWNVRRDACKALGDLADAGKAEPHLQRLRDLAASDPDYEVKKAARRALQQLRERGVQPRAAGPEAAAGASAGAPEDGRRAAHSGPTLLLRVFGDVLPMRTEREGVTPAELAELWEGAWGVQYASRVRFEAPEGSPTRHLNPREDAVPLSPAVVTLHCGVGSILLALATALKSYGMLSEDEVGAERERRRRQQAVESERRQEADAKEHERWRKAEMRRQQRRADESGACVTNAPFVRNKTLGEQTVAGL
uniref:Uncharacterized protein n=1 Tax=Alexandrium monilatum TaxID=311494 RepID=A0A7S4PSD9_9DINO